MSDSPRYRGGTLAAFQLEGNKLRTREERKGAWCVRRQARRRKGGGSVEKGSRNEQKWIGTRERGRKGSGRVEAYIGDDRDRRGFPNNAASGAIAFREENSFRRLDISRQEKEEGKIRGE